MCIRDRAVLALAHHVAAGSLAGHAAALNAAVLNTLRPVSYTHLDVYKRQGELPDELAALATGCNVPSFVTKMKFAPPVSSTFVRVAASRYIFSAKP